MGGVDGIADHLQCEIGLHAGAHLEIAVVHQRPAAMDALNPAQVIGDLAFQHRVDRLAEIVAQQHILGGDGAIGFQFEHPVAVGLPIAQQPARRRRDTRLQSVTGPGASWFIAGMHLSRYPLEFTPRRL